MYRGIDNPIKIAVPGAKSFIATAKDSALVKIDDLGNYRLRARSGNEMKIYIDAVMQDNSVVHEEKTFRIKGFSEPKVTLNDESRNSYMMTKKALIESVVNLSFENMLIYESNVDFGIKQFNVTIPLRDNKNKTITVNGNKMNGEVASLLRKVKPRSIVVISYIKIWNKVYMLLDKPPSPIAIEILN